MKKSIINLLNQNGYYPTDVDDEIIIKIDLLLENPKLSVELCDRKLIWIEKKSKFKYNMKLLLLDGFCIDGERFVNLGSEVKLSFIFNQISDFINRKNIKYLTSNTTGNTDDDPFSESNIMRDLKKGRGYKHGLD